VSTSASNPETVPGTLSWGDIFGGLSLGVALIALAVAIYIGWLQLRSERRVTNASGEEERVRSELAPLAELLPALQMIPHRLRVALVLKDPAARDLAISNISREEWGVTQARLQSALATAKICGHLSDDEYTALLLGDDPIVDDVLNTINAVQGNGDDDYKARTIKKLSGKLEIFEKQMRQLIAHRCQQARREAMEGKAVSRRDR
jgi:hypothetical protein